MAFTVGIEPNASEFHSNLKAKYATPLSLWFEVHEVSSSKRLDADCESEP